MNIYTAFLHAADEIEQRPKLFAFQSTLTPDCKTPGCALGWVGAVLQLPKVWWRSPEFYELLGLPMGDCGEAGDAAFYRRMDNLLGHGEWRSNANVCADGLRLYAEKYHAHEKPEPKGIPSSVRQIFEVETA